MTLSKPRQGTYDPNYNPLPATVTIGCSLITHEVDDLIIDGRHVQVPVEDAICYITAPREVVYTAKGGADYSTIAKLIEEQEGLLRKHYKLVHVWATVPDHEAPF